MKKQLLIITFLAFTGTIFAQISVRPGVRAGANFSNITNVDFDTKTDFYIGGFAGINFTKFYTLQAEVTYTRQGAKSRVNNVDDLEIQYMSVAIANKFKPVQKIGLHAIIGPGINFKVGDNINGPVNLEGFDFVFFGGLGYDLPFGLTVEARYNLGVIDILGDNINNTVSVDDVRLNKVFQVGAAYKFDW